LGSDIMPDAAMDHGSGDHRQPVDFKRRAKKETLDYGEFHWGLPVYHHF
jgi:hypothetical protein